MPLDVVMLMPRRFISNRSLPATFVARLTSDQTQLEHVQLTSSAMESIMYDVRRFRHLRTLDVQVLQARELADALYAAVSFSDTLERLSLGVMTMSSPDTFASMSSWFRRRTPCRSQAYHLPKLKELGLRNVDLKNSCVILSELTDLHALTSLNLSQCKGFEQFFSQLALEANDKRFKLTEMAFNTLMEEHPLERFETSSFESVLFACDALQSLHFAWSESCDISSWVVRTIENIGDSLQSLSLHCDIDFSPYPPLCESEFEAVCVACPNLQQLGYRLEDGVLSESRPDYTSTPHFMVCTSNEVKRNADWRQECMQYLPDLRTLHLREPNNPGHDPGIPGLDFTNPSAASRNYQQFASAFFIYLHSRNWCPKLQALVIGELSTNKKATEPQSYCYVPQHCFVRGFQKDAANRTVTVGVAVTREELMRIEPISDILGFDVNCDWVGGLSGRFHDL